MISLDTSVIYALADRADPNHLRAKEMYASALQAGEDLLTHSYVLVESAALLQSRLGLSAALRFLDESQSFRVHWVTPRDHQEAVQLLRERGAPRAQPGGLRELRGDEAPRGQRLPGLRRGLRPRGLHSLEPVARRPWVQLNGSASGAENPRFGRSAEEGRGVLRPAHGDSGAPSP